MLPSSKNYSNYTASNRGVCSAEAGAMAKHTEHTILGVIENMSYFESKETGKSMFSEKEEQKAF